ncbi:hypothetical protein ALC60_02978 [Trachymyrmex zeteki]|uniref:Kazal-like domain-containing protein n=1 Tax=Mycetomoellerius zeteki TaxID=64791 RepID=A0A151XC57_9HYME|nr:hypothetical protein ALC60_02978 [Trachymyrmex zeteki]
MIWLVALAFPQRDWSGNVVDDSIIFDNNDEVNSSTPPSSTTQGTINNNNNNTNTNNNNNCPCIATAEYNPICGTDNVTYWNIGRFNCAKNCNPQLEIRVIRACEPYIQLSKPLVGNRFYIKASATNAAKQYVCISQNLDNASVEMAQVDGFIFDGPVASESNGQQRITSTSTTTSSIILDNIYNVCVMNCPVTTEYNPVCGTDNADYVNPGRLGCAQRCGKGEMLHKINI